VYRKRAFSHCVLLGGVECGVYLSFLALCITRGVTLREKSALCIIRGRLGVCHMSAISPAP